MKVFISWSGPQSRQIAEALRDWLPAMFESVEPYMSARDNEAGVRWNAVISSELDESDFGILCLTPDNLQAPWLLFEAGALSKSVAVARVVPLLWRLSPANVTSPLSQFHMKEADTTGVRDVVAAINSALDRPRPDSALTAAFDALWPMLEQRLAAITEPAETANPERSDRQILEEILEIVRARGQVSIYSSGVVAAAARSDARARRERSLIEELQDHVGKGGLIEAEPGRLTVRVKNPRAYQAASRVLALHESAIKEVGLEVEISAPQAVLDFLEATGDLPALRDGEDV